MHDGLLRPPATASTTRIARMRGRRPRGWSLRVESLETRRMMAGWPVQVGGSDLDEGRAIATLADGSALVTGSFSGTAVFGGTTLTSSGGEDAFVAKLRTDGTFAWAVRAGGTGSDVATAVAALADGSVIVAGSFADTAVFGGKTLTSTGGSDVFVAKLNADGTFAWATKGGGSLDDGAAGVVAFPGGAVVVTGQFWDTATFGGTTLISNGQGDVFVATLDAGGNFVRAGGAGGSDFDDARAIDAFTDGSVVVTGTFSGTMTFGNATLASAGQGDVFVAKVNADGTLAWAARAGGSLDDVGYDVAALAGGSVAVTGSFSETATFGGATLTSAGLEDVFVATVAADGTFASATRAGGIGYDQGLAIAALADGSAVVTGQLGDAASFGSTTLPGDGYVAKLAADGTFAWARGSSAGYGIAGLADGSALVTGVAAGSTLASGDTDVFIAKIDSAGAFVRTRSPALGAVDLNGDGITDSIWQSTSGQSVGSIYGLTGAVVQTRNLGGDATWSIDTFGDFDGNGVSDFVWRNAVTGQNVLWLMQSSGTRLSTRSLGGDLTWRIESTGDFNGDGRTDLVWRSSATGRNVLWLMNGSAVVTATPLGGDLSWRLVATTADYDSNGDGRTDLLWRYTSGLTVLHRMNGGRILSTQRLGGDADWQIVATGDFNGDGKHDLVWRQTSGAVAQWLMNDGVLVGAASLGGNSAWAPIVGIDANGDGRSDLVWRNLTSGATTIWLMNGSTVSTTMSLGGNTTWKLLARPGRKPV